MDFQNCANCGACASVCPRGAIEAEGDGLFYRPVIKTEKCVECGLCKAVCPIHREHPTTEVKSAWWGHHKDDAVVKTSSSGGAFTALAEYVLKQNGVVFGAAYEDDCRSVSIRSTEEVPLEALKRSKYVESQPGNAFRKVKAYLQQGRMVLVCATPCQIAGLMAFLGKPYENLIACDFACGGLPSHKLYEQYLTMLEKRFGGTVASVNFRPKTYGWSQYAISISFNNGKKYVRSADRDPFFRGFIHQRINMRPYCYDCGFAEKHCADLNLADFWKYRTLTKERRNESGLSMILAFTEKGKTFLETAAETMDLKDLETEVATYNLKKKEKTQNRMQKREQYLSICQQDGFEAGIPLLQMPAQTWKLRVKCFVKKVMYGVK